MKTLDVQPATGTRCSRGSRLAALVSCPLLLLSSSCLYVAAGVGALGVLSLFVEDSFDSEYVPYIMNMTADMSTVSCGDVFSFSDYYMVVDRSPIDGLQQEIDRLEEEIGKLRVLQEEESQVPHGEVRSDLSTEVARISARREAMRTSFATAGSSRYEGTHAVLQVFPGDTIHVKVNEEDEFFDDRCLTASFDLDSETLKRPSHQITASSPVWQQILMPGGVYQSGVLHMGFQPVQTSEQVPEPERREPES